MKVLAIITPLFLCATLAEAAKKPKLPKFGGSGGGEEEESVAAQDDQAEETTNNFFAQATATGPRDVYVYCTKTITVDSRLT